MCQSETDTATKGSTASNRTMRVSALLNLSVPGQTSLLHSLGTKRLGEDRAMSHGRYVRQ